MDEVIYALTLVSALGCAITAGWFFAFSNHIMPSLGRRPEAEGIATMNEITVGVINPLTMTALFGTGLTSIALAVLSVVEWKEPAVFYQLAGSVLYVVGTPIVTILFNVPLNNALEAADPTNAAGTQLWQRYLSEWTFWNSVRTVAPLAALVLLMIGLAEM